MIYDFSKIEKKWQENWEKNPIKAKPVNDGKKYYCLDMFPYPSGSGLHVGHWRGYTLSDVYSRIKLLEGYNVLHPMGWDAFGLPAENDAIKRGIHPKISTASNIANFKKQLKEIGAVYDWDKELDTTDPQYYKWTQWIFLQMYKAGLAYQADASINWCPSCLTGLANEEVISDACERCSTKVIQRKIRQWILKITAYADKLLEGLDRLPLWPEKVKTMQRNWIGKSEGLLFSAPVKDSHLIIETYSTHFEAFAADTFVVIAPDHELLPELLKNYEKKDEVLEFCKQMVDQRTKDPESVKEPMGIFTGQYLIDPVGNGELQIWVANYVLKDYGTGIVKCSAHDERDFKFAKKYNIPLKVVLVPENDPELKDRIKKFEVCYTDMQNGILTEPGIFAGKIAGHMRQAIADHCVQEGFAVKKTQYKLRDWIFSRQRYWGEPIPLVHCPKDGVVPVPENELPIQLPEVDKYQPTGTGESPLAGIDSWVNTTCPKCGEPAKRETNTMPQWAGSCWYFLRYPNPQLKTEAFDKKDMQYWLPVDLYVGGIEHAILHLLYSRFYIKVLHDLKFLDFDEPFTQLFNQGMVLKYSTKTGLVEKMSKSKGNVVNPDDIIKEYGSDVLRMYILFMGPPELDCEWQDKGLEGIKRFLNRFWVFATDTNNIVEDKDETIETTKRFHQFLKDYQDRLAHFKPNTAVSSAMEFINYLYANQAKLSKTNLEQLIVSVSVLAPHMASELLEQIFAKQFINCVWPKYNAQLAANDFVTYAVQVNGKLRGNLVVDKGTEQDIVEKLAKEDVQKWLEDKTVVKVIFVKDKIISFVVR